MSKLSVVGEGLLSPHNSTNIIEINKQWQKWLRWLETAQSFRYVPNNNEPPYTARQENVAKDKLVTGTVTEKLVVFSENAI
ncbi:hypothetical protein H6G41_30820 [Tolypothrix sp. FACHB-123]|uniref:hypothetical protein n=1 Tax=Tolypothrix sp. FACHB-123 TaxID=2692868 RepID=UPI0016851EE4|nr:hypothetical protein [Tolypothrix sp. FACHB-123]MBD2358941.1 hypothetical protein [Tolypothrix sp. FACHB-123]